VVAFAVYMGVAALTQSQQKPRGPTDSCVDAGCHATLTKGRVRHDPVARGRCLDCHAYAAAEEHLFRLTMPKRDLCGSCHAVALSSTVHTPVAEGNCTGCHDPHASDHPALLKGDPAGGLCASCHDPSAFDKAFMHGPVAVGACVICHEPHTSSHKGLLAQDPKTLCVTCHLESAPTGAAARHEHRPMRDGCTTCHDPHASDVRFQLKEEIPGLCFGCHQGIERLVSSSPIVHRVLDDRAQCTQCHEPHYAPLPALQRRAQPDLCLQCHDRPVETDDGRVLADMRALLAENPNHHGPIREGACTSCHQPHGAEHFRLLLKEYPPEFYAPFDLDRYGLCFACHLPDLVQDRSGTGLTGFREGDLNLHWLHVNQEKGRTCRACHEVHASQRPFHIRESVPFGTGGWMLEINFEQTADGGTCTPACHRSQSYRRTATDGTTPTGGTP
jgi:predicted CXXCH cytochrome family protein